MMTFAEHSDRSTRIIVESAVISPGVAKAAAVGILLKMKSLSGQIRQLKGPDTIAHAALSTQLVLLASMVALGIGTLDSNPATGPRR